MTTVRVQVTQEDITNGEPGEPCQCPVARAMIRVLPDHLWVWVNAEEIEIDDVTGLPVANITNPAEVIDFICEYDDPAEGDDPRALKPFAFDLDIPDEVLARSAA